MGKKKLMRYSEFDQMPNTYDYINKELKGNWNSDVFKNDNPIVLELACGGGEYSIGMAELDPQKNYIGIDIKGERLWKGGKKSLEKGLTNVTFLRIQIESIDDFFAANEVSEIWILFPDPQPQVSRIKKRLTNIRFLQLYRKVSKADTLVNLKTDSPLFYNYTKDVIKEHELIVLEDFEDVYKLEAVTDILNIKTYYELKWLKENRVIRYLKFKLNP